MSTVGYPAEWQILNASWRLWRASPWKKGWSAWKNLSIDFFARSLFMSINWTFFIETRSFIDAKRVLGGAKSCTINIQMCIFRTPLRNLSDKFYTKSGRIRSRLEKTICKKNRNHFLYKFSVEIFFQEVIFLVQLKGLSPAVHVVFQHCHPCCFKKSQ